MSTPLQPGQLEACAGWYRVSRMLQLAVRLDVASTLRDSPLDVSELTSALGTHPQATRAFIDALLAWGVLARDAEGRLTLTAVSRRLLPDAPDALPLSLVSGWAGHDVVFEAWAGLEHTLRTGESGLARAGGGDFESRLAASPQASALYQAAMSSTVAGFEACATLLMRLGFERVVDIGGGRGDLLRAVLDRAPRARGLCFDLPHVVNALPPTCDERLEYVAGDALEHVPPHADLYLTSTVLRCLTDPQVATLLSRVRDAMTQRHARLVCFELLRPEVPDAQASLQALTAFVVYGGRDRSATEFESLFRASGLRWAGAERVEGNLHALHVTRPRSPLP